MFIIALVPFLAFGQEHEPFMNEDKTIKKFPISSGMESVYVGGYELGEGMFLYSLIVNGQEIDTKKMVISK